VRRAGWLLLLAACGGDDDPVAAPPPPPSTLSLVDGTADAGLDGYRNANGTPENRTIDESFGAGVALFDADGDGDLDAFVVGGDGPDAYFENDGRGSFTERAAEVGLTGDGWGYGVLARDHDGDGDVDLYVTQRGPNRLYENRGGTFVEVAAERGVADARWSTGACFLDYDRDGDLDLYVANHIELDKEAAGSRSQDFFGLEVYYGPLGLEAQPDALYRQEADGTFTDVSEETGVGDVAYFSFQVVAFDWDGDGWQDLYVANDSTPNVLWHNQAGAGFEDVARRNGVALSVSGDPQAGMGVAVGDPNGDGNDDLYVTNFSEDYFTLYQGQGGGRFRDATAPSGLYSVTLASLGWGTVFEDLDADGDQDLFVANGHVFPQVDELGRQTRYRQRNQLFENVSEAAGTSRFREPTGGGGAGLALEAVSRGVAVGDVDGDGDRDVLVGNLDGPVSLLRNESAGGAALVLELIGAGGNRDAVGARVAATCAGRTLTRTVGDGSGFLSSSSPRVHLGLGQASGASGVTITWTDGSTAALGDLAAGKRYTITQGEGVTAEADLTP